MYKDKEFTKDMISWQSTIVKFRNGLVGLAINDKISEDDHDGDEAFIDYNPTTKSFITSARLCCYDNNLRNTLSMKGILGKIDNVIKNGDGKVELADTDWDVVNVVVYPYALDAFRVITSGEKIYWLYQINK